jgi:hypothetical protein
VTFHCGKEQDQTLFFRELVDGAIQAGSKLIGCRQIFGRWGSGLALWLSPRCFAMLTTVGRFCPIKGESKSDTHKPSFEACAVAQFIETAVGAQNGVLGHIFGVGGVAQDTASHAKGQRATFGEAFFKFAAQGAFGSVTLKVGLCRVTRLDQNQLLHR